MKSKDPMSAVTKTTVAVIIFKVFMFDMKFELFKIYYIGRDSRKNNIKYCQYQYQEFYRII